jgi:hypothetical protein
MAILVLPVRSDLPAYAFQVTLEGALYRFEIRWNDRDGLWSLSLYDKAGVLLVAGRKIVLGASLLGRSVDARLPPGAVLAMDTSGANVDAGQNDLGGRVSLLYYESTGP